MTELTHMCRVLDRDDPGFTGNPSPGVPVKTSAQTRRILTSSILDFGNPDKLFGNLDSIAATVDV